MPNDEPPNVLTLLSGAGKPDASAEAMRALVAELQTGVTAKRLELIASMMRLKFLSLVRAGFTEAQALYLVGVLPY